MNNQVKHDLVRQGYSHLKTRISTLMLNEINTEFHALSTQANGILQDIKQQGVSYADYYSQGHASFITVPESDNPSQICRFEYIKATSTYMREQLIPLCASEIRKQLGKNVSLFKDKCNFKSPGGGAFTAHQDIPAYIHFGPTIHVTAAVFLDPATEENGALEMANNYMQLDGEGIEWINTPLGKYPLCSTYQGGIKNGRILESLEQQLDWQPFFAEAGDIILFHSYIPHRSAINQSNNTRRAFFFTFNLSQDGDHYEAYYQSKRTDFSNLRFHIATPTQSN